MATRVRLVAAGIAEVHSAAEDYARDLALDIGVDMEIYVPVLTGALRSTIRVEAIPGGARILVGDPSLGVDYHLFVEYGTSRMAAQPYIRPAVYQWRGV